MDPALQKSLTLGVLPPAIFTGIVLLLAWWWRRMPESAEARAALLPPSTMNTRGERLWLSPLVFAVAYLPVHHFLLGGFKFSLAITRTFVQVEKLQHQGVFD